MTTVLSDKPRIASVDILRGLVMIIMALDHVREYWSVTLFSPEDLTQTSAALFFTRWITHFCAPTFSFLAGISIFLQASQKSSKGEMSRFLLKRGLWLILLQIVFLNFLSQFNYNLLILEVIWVLGWSMIVMAALIWLPDWAVALFAMVIIAGHNALPAVQVTDAGTFILALLHNSPTIVPLPGLPVIVIAYTIIPWAGVMAAGYVAGRIFSFEAHRQQRYWYTLGGICLLLFIGLRFINGYGDPLPWTTQERGAGFTLISFLNVSKYPPSLLFLLLTLGVACLLIPVLDKASGRLASIVRTFGEVPLFFFVIHIPLIVLGAHLWTYFNFGQFITLTFYPRDLWPSEYQPSLVRTYLVWLLYLVVLYFACRWYRNYKLRTRKWWSLYL